MAQLKAWNFSKTGSPRDILTLATLPAPSFPPTPPLPKSSQWILVKTAYAGLNPGPLYVMQLVPTFLHATPMVPDFDLSGTVVDTWSPPGDESPNEGGFVKGEEILACIPSQYSFPTGTGALATHVVIPAEYAVRKPPGRGLREGGGVLMSGMCAWEMCRLAGLKQGDKVLVNAASGGIGSVTLQMARGIVGDGGYVAAICSGEKRELVEGLGAERVFDYKTPGLAETLAGVYKDAPFDAVLDAVGIQALYKSSPAYLAPEGVYASVGIKTTNYALSGFVPAFTQMLLNEYWPVSTWLGGVGRLWKPVSLVNHTPEMRERVVRMWGEGAFEVVVNEVVGFEGVVGGYERLSKGGVGGKILVKVTDEDV